MPIRGDRLRWPPRPGKRLSEHAARRVPAATPQPISSQQPLPQPNERDESADAGSGAPRAVIRQAHDDVESGKEDTDCRNRTSEVASRR